MRGGSGGIRTGTLLRVFAKVLHYVSEAFKNVVPYLHDCAHTYCRMAVGNTLKCFLP